MCRPLRLPGNLQRGMPQNKTCLIIAQSGRALAVSARMAGWTAHVLDRFSDQDTAAAALSCQSVSGTETGFLQDELLEKLSCYSEKSLLGVIYGSGLEAHYDVLEFLGRNWPLLGNDATVVRACKEPALFFPILSRLGIPFPPTCLKVPQDFNEEEKWIMKQTGASGGGHIRLLGAETGPTTEADVYYQKKLSGRSLSVVFLADTLNAIIVGMNETWTVAPGKNDFRYGGAMTEFNLADAISQALLDVIRVLAREFGLKGLCGMDVIVDEHGECYVLEINPRPTATFELHQTQQSLCEAHVLACQGKLLSLPPRPAFLQAHQVWYADRNFIMPDVAWPKWISDRPYPGRCLKVNDPVCMVHAEAACEHDIKTLLQNRSATLMRLMGLQKLAA